MDETTSELGACDRCELGADGWRLCPEHRPDHQPRSLNHEHHLARARAALDAARKRHPTAS
jgi:hypothetical protein